MGSPSGKKAVSENWSQDVVHVEISRQEFSNSYYNYIQGCKERHTQSDWTKRNYQQRTGNFNKEIEILELKNSLVGLKSILETTAERVSELTIDQ